MRITNFNYRYNVTINGRLTGTWFTSRDEARAYKRELASSNTSRSYKIVRQSASWGSDTTVR